MVPSRRTLSISKPPFGVKNNDGLIFFGVLLLSSAVMLAGCHIRISAEGTLDHQNRLTDKAKSTHPNHPPTRQSESTPTEAHTPWSSSPKSDSKSAGLSISGSAHLRSTASGKMATNGDLGPDTPPPNPFTQTVADPNHPFGSTEPKPSCARGEVFALHPGIHKLPRKWGTPKTLVHTCAFNVAPGAFATGFDDVPELIEWFAIRYRGQFTVVTAGSYMFRLRSDDGARLVVDGKMIINNDGRHPAIAKTGTVVLDPGRHRFTLSYFQAERFLVTLQLHVTGPDGVERLFRTDQPLGDK